MCESYELSLTCISPSYVTHTYEILRITKQPLSWSVYKSQIQGYYRHEKVMSGDEEFPLSLLSLFLSSLSLPSQTQQTNKRKTNKKTARRIWLGFLRICRAFCVFEFAIWESAARDDIWFDHERICFCSPKREGYDGEEEKGNNCFDQFSHSFLSIRFLFVGLVSHCIGSQQTNRAAKLKQSKLGLRREQWLSQGNDP